MPSNVQDLILVIESEGDRECFREVLGYGIYGRVVDVSEIERVSAANE